VTIKWGPTSQAPPEAVLAYETVYDASLGLGALREASSEELTAHCRKVAEAIPADNPEQLWKLYMQLTQQISLGL